MRTDSSVTLHNGRPMFSLLAGSKLLLTNGHPQEVREIPLSDALLFQNIAANGDNFCVAGQRASNDGLGILVITPEQVINVDTSRPAPGVNPVAVRAMRDGWHVAVMNGSNAVEDLFISSDGTLTAFGITQVEPTSQGIRCFDGDRLIMGDPVHRIIAGRALSEAMKVGEWWVGQDSHAPRIVAVREQDGFAFTLFNSASAKFPQAVITPEGHFAVTAMDSVYRMEIIPVAAQSDPSIGQVPETPQPTPAPEPTPQPTPTPEEPMPEPRPLYEEVKAERAKYGTPMTPTELGILLNTIAWNARADGWGLSAKPHGHNVPSPAGVKIAQDILHHKPTNTLYDVLGSGETLAIPAWGKALYHGDPEGRPWVAPVRPSEEQPEPEPEPEPIPEPEPKPKPECECSKELAGLKETIAVMQLAIKAHSDQIVELQSKTPTVLKAKGTTSKAWGHVHQVELTLTAE